MNLFIRILDGEPFEHPILEDNFRAAYPDVDIDNLPPEFARFQRVERPETGVYEVSTVSYEWVDGLVSDVWTLRPMTDQERQDKIAEVMAAPHPEHFIFSEEECAWVPDLNASGSAPDVIG